MAGIVVVGSQWGDEGRKDYKLHRTELGYGSALPRW